MKESDTQSSYLLQLENLLQEYDHDGIDWTKVDFEDNQECLNLFEKKPLGLFSLLDEESTFPKGTDLTFAHKLNQHLNANPRFKGKRGGAFSVHHYAGEVLYDTSGFLEKNRDLLHSDSVQLLSSCSCQLPQLFASNMLNQSQKPGSPLWRLGGADSQKQSVGMKFKGQLFKLMQRLENTTPHFIRCIKPNSKQLPGMYEKELVLQQLKCCGVLEVVRISRSGYPTRMTHQQFARRYGFLLLENVVSEDPLSVSVAILQQFNIQPDMYQVDVRGESARKEFGLLTRRQRAVLLIQKHIKQQITRKSFKDQKNAIIHLQSVIRAWLARRQFEILQNLGESNIKLTKMETEVDVEFQETKNSKHEHIKVLPSVLSELHRRVMKAEAALRQKDDENETLQQQLKQYERRWLEYENKMKSMEETWQRQFTSLQMSLAAAKRTLAADDIVGQAGRPDASPGLHYYDSEDGISAGSRTPDGMPFRAPTRSSDVDGGRLAVSRLAKEFERHKQVFDDDAGFLVEVKSRQHVVPDMNPDEELRKLKARFAIWKKEYKVRLRETKVALQKLGNAETDKSKKKWWGKRSTKT
ncbi:hypothetical protein MRB53_014260 [Persea americana]|uniref:Uncharacterized protein n=1 Tax=Persea americana TaxID=3435 RepID=A0ACC2KAV3_PERAE|nr:hypothetical protein MRB53_014260 [Persea americana]